MSGSHYHCIHFGFHPHKKTPSSKRGWILLTALACCLLLAFHLFPGPVLPVGAGADGEEEGIFLPVAMYHSILKDQSRAGKFIVSPETLEQDFKWLKDHGYTAVLPRDLIEYVYQNKPLPDQPVMITFDDGYYNNALYALPLLEKYDMKAVISVVGEYLETASASGDRNPAYAYLNWTDLQELDATGRIEIASHTYKMHNTTPERKGCGINPGENEEEYREILSADVSTLQLLLQENAGLEPVTFTYPFGNTCRESVPVLREMGFLCTLNCYEAPNYITQSPGTLIGINRYNRPAGESTDAFMRRMTKK